MDSCFWCFVNPHIWWFMGSYEVISYTKTLQTICLGGTKSGLPKCTLFTHNFNSHFSQPPNKYNNGLTVHSLLLPWPLSSAFMRFTSVWVLVSGIGDGFSYVHFVIGSAENSLHELMSFGWINAFLQFLLCLYKALDIVTRSYMYMQLTV